MSESWRVKVTAHSEDGVSGKQHKIERRISCTSCGSGSWGQHIYDYAHNID